MIILIVLFSVLAVATIVGSIFCILKLKKINNKFRSSNILVPLKQKKAMHMVSICLLAIFFVLDIVLIAVEREYIVGSCLMVIILSLSLVVIELFKFKSAVLNDGIIIPYRFISNKKLINYNIQNNSICFYGDDKGYDTITSFTPIIRFENSNKDTLIEALDKFGKENDSCDNIVF